ncbi:hypothetical protein EYC84_007676 [Monilinia fructicola]|uniref:Uncharacterized protein n=1 Tax=Monilinia fructicola TaxID=38448 RepID=A0A5M9JL14_MONFR|nr:hypothetical protein EYC84_007676 [Monilinia fructicola]
MLVLMLMLMLMTMTMTMTMLDVDNDVDNDNDNDNENDNENEIIDQWFISLNQQPSCTTTHSRTTCRLNLCITSASQGSFLLQGCTYLSVPAFWSWIDGYLIIDVVNVVLYGVLEYRQY